MVKNKKGGSGHKRMARKNISDGGGYQNKLRKKQEDAEIYARVIKLNGGQFAHIKCEDGNLFTTRGVGNLYFFKIRT